VGVTEPARLNHLANVLRDRQILIADGHHRYETMLSLRGELRGAGGAGAREPADYGAMYLARAEDPGLLVLPTHRLVRDLPDFKARRSCTPRRRPSISSTARRRRRRPARRASRRSPRATTGSGASPSACACPASAARPGSCSSRSSISRRWGRPRCARSTSTVLHGVLLGPLLGIDAAAMEKQTHLTYTHDTAEALARVDAGQVQAAFLMNATTLAQVLEACEQGHVLPQKSTYFQPKLATGLVLYPVERGTMSLAR